MTQNADMGCDWQLTAEEAADLIDVEDAADLIDVEQRDQLLIVWRLVYSHGLHCWRLGVRKYVVQGAMLALASELGYPVLTRREQPALSQAETERILKEALPYWPGRQPRP